MNNNKMLIDLYKLVEDNKKEILLLKIIKICVNIFLLINLINK